LSPNEIIDSTKSELQKIPEDSTEIVTFAPKRFSSRYRGQRPESPKIYQRGNHLKTVAETTTTTTEAPLIRKALRRRLESRQRVDIPKNHKPNFEEEKEERVDVVENSTPKTYNESVESSEPKEITVEPEEEDEEPTVEGLYDGDYRQDELEPLEVVQISALEEIKEGENAEQKDSGKKKGGESSKEEKGGGEEHHEDVHNVKGHKDQKAYKGDHHHTKVRQNRY